MGLFDNAVPGGNITKPLMIALGALLVSKMLGGKHDSEQTGTAQTPAANDANPAPDGGILGGLGGLLDRLKEAGQGHVADSWVSSGPNKEIDTTDLGKAIGPQIIREIAQKTGMDEQELLKQLSAALPGLVDKLTPNGQVPSHDQVRTAFNS